MPEDSTIASTNGVLGDLYADAVRKELYCLVECPPVGKLRLTIRSNAFTFDVRRSKKADGTLVLRLKDAFLKNRASETVRVLYQISPHWDVLWPRIYEALLQVRKDYKRSEGVTNENCSLVLFPPEPEDEYWGCELQLDPWDGFYTVKFNTSGETVDACAGF